MALTRTKKHEVAERARFSLVSNPVVVAVKYTGMSVAELEQLRKVAREQSIWVSVIKNRLFIRVIWKGMDPEPLKGQLLYLFGPDLEDIARLITGFPKLVPVLGYTREMKMNYDEPYLRKLMALPSKEQLINDILSIGDVSWTSRLSPKS